MANGKRILAGVGLAAGTLFALYKGVTALAGREPPKYSREWIEALTDAEWAAERQIIQDQYRNPALDIDFRESRRMLLFLFDKGKSAKDWAGQTPKGPAYHREHGYNLYKPD